MDDKIRYNVSINLNIKEINLDYIKEIFNKKLAKVIVKEEKSNV